MVTEWTRIMDKRPSDRTEEELGIIYNRLRSIQAFEKYHPTLLHQMCYFGYYEDLDKGVTLFRQGDKGTNWYAVLAGSLDVQVVVTSPILDDPKHYYFSLIFCWPPNCPDQIAVDKYEVEHILYNPEVPGKFDKYIFKYSTKCLKLKVSDD